MRQGASRAFKAEIRNVVGLDTQGDRRINRSVTREAQNLLNRSRHNRR